MGLRHFALALARLISLGNDPRNDILRMKELGQRCGMKSGRPGGLGPMARPPRIATRKSVARFWKTQM